MECMIVYQSKTGYTKRYVEMLSENVEATLVELKSLNSSVLSNYDTIIYAAGVYGGKISGITKFLKLIENIQFEKLIVVAVGASPPTNEVRKKLMNDNLITESIINTSETEFAYLQGGFDPNKLNFALRTMLIVVSNRLQKKQNKNPESLTDEDNAFLDFFRTTHDHTSKEQLLPIINFIGTTSFHE